MHGLWAPPRADPGFESPPPLHLRVTTGTMHCHVTLLLQHSEACAHDTPIGEGHGHLMERPAAGAESALRRDHGHRPRAFTASQQGPRAYFWMMIVDSGRRESETDVQCAKLLPMLLDRVHYWRYFRHRLDAKNFTKIFRFPVTSNLWTHAWSIKYR
jgi:hypothetical protein